MKVDIRMRTTLIFLDLNKDFDSCNQAHSNAGNQVQSEILRNLREVLLDKSDVVCVSHNPLSTWPKGPFFYKGEKAGDVIYPTYLNAPILKSLSYLFNYVYYCLLYKPGLILKYNASLGEALTLKFVRLILNCKVALIIQDVFLPQGEGVRKFIKRFCNHHAIRVARSFDVLVPITRYIANAYRFSPKKTIVFQGGVTRQTRDILDGTTASSYEELACRAVFAGALEPYNGVDLLIKKWVDEGVTVPLHVFGNGSLRSLVEDGQRDSKGNIIYMGSCDEATVTEYIKTSKINICLRYSQGINEELFFPSKFINLCAAPGALLCNSFKNMPADLIPHCEILRNDIKTSMQVIIDSSSRKLELNHSQRVKWLCSNANWSVVVKKIIVMSEMCCENQE